MSRVFFNCGSVSGGTALPVMRVALANIAAAGEGRPHDSGEHQIRHHLLALGLGAEEQRQTPAD